MTDRVLILDFGSQVTQLIARRIREHNVYSEIRPFDISIEEIKHYDPRAIILSGGPASTSHEEAPKISKDVFELGLPILGICYGQQLMCELLGGKVESSDEREFGRATIKVTEHCGPFENVWDKGTEHQVWMSHGDRVVEIPEGFAAVAVTDSAPFAAIANEGKGFYGVQFHPEVVHTPDGSDFLKNFIVDVAGCKQDWTMANFLEVEIAKVKEQVGDKKVICGVSGGVDSTVVATLLHKAIGDQLTCIFVDTGLLRLDEATQVKQMFDDYHVPLDQVNASELFLSKLEGISDPEEKRKIIGGTFIDVFEEEAKKIGGAEFLAQGTLYPDVIESVSVYAKSSSTIKSHHNVGGLPERMNMELVEPVRELFKDEVRALGKELGLKDEMLKRHPFPGPGLGIRIPGEITKEKIEILQRADSIYIKELKDSALYDEIWQAFAVLLPVKTVGVMGDSRTYEYVCGLRAVTSTDGMTADFYPFDGEFLSKVSTNIVNNVKGINRVVYDITSKPPGTIEWE